MAEYFNLVGRAGDFDIWPVFADAAVKGLLLLSVVWVATLAMRRASAAARHLTWLLAVAGVLVLPVLSALLPDWRVLPAWLTLQPLAVTSPVSAASRREPALVVGGPQDIALSERVAQRSDVSPTFAATQHGSRVSPQATVPANGVVQPQTAARSSQIWWRRIRWQTWMLAAWACGMAVMLLPLIVSLLSLSRLGRRLPRIEGGSWGHLLTDCAGRLRVRHPITLLQGRPLGIPMTWGVASTKLLLPADSDQWSQSRRRVVLLHELAHVKRWDFLTQLIVRFARAVFWFNPLLWIAARQMAVESEGACDDLVLTHEIKPSDYAEHLLAVAAGLKEGHWQSAAAVAMAKSSRLERRLVAILDAGRNRRTPSVAAIVIAIGSLAGGLLPLAMLRAGPTKAAMKPVVANRNEAVSAAQFHIAAQLQEGAARAAGPPPVNVAAPQPPAVGELVGLVTDEAGNPLAGVLVDVWSWCPGNETTTDQQGGFILKKLGTEPVEVRISREGFGPWYNPVQPTGAKSLQVKLSNKTYFEGVVQGPDGKPLPEALVRADSGPKSNPSVEITTVWTETRSDKNGRYRLYVTPDNYQIQVRVPKVGAVRLPQTQIGDGEVKKLNLNLVPGATFRAVVVDSETGKPVPNVRLFHWEHKGVEGLSGNDGKIEIGGMPAGKFTFNVSSPGYARWWSPQAAQPQQRKDIRDSLQQNFDHLEFDVSEDMEAVRIELEREVRITGVVQDPDGNPVAGATAAPAHTGTGNSLTGDTRYSVPTDKDGTFVMTLPASGNVKYNLTAHDGHHGQWRKWANGVLDPIQTKPGDELKNVVIKLTRPATVRGHVQDEAGKPLANREVRASAVDKLENRYYDPTTKTDQNGDFELRFIRPGEQFIQAAPFFWTNVPPGGMTLKLKPGETNSLQVKLTAGETKTGVELTAPASTAFPSREEQLRRAIERLQGAEAKP